MSGVPASHRLMVEHPWVRRSRSRDTSVLVAAVSDEATLREARLQIGVGAVGRAMETARSTDATAPARSAGPSRIPDDLTARCAEALALPFLRSLAGFPTDDLPDVIGQSVRECIRQNLPVGLSTLWARGPKVSGDPLLLRRSRRAAEPRTSWARGGAHRGGPAGGGDRGIPDQSPPGRRDGRADPRGRSRRRGPVVAVQLRRSGAGHSAEIAAGSQRRVRPP